MNNNDFFNRWAIITGMIQFLDYDLILKDATNTDLLKELQKQDAILEEHSQELQRQTNYYLKKIIEQNNEILKKLTEKEE